MRLRYDADADAAYVSLGREPRAGEAVAQISGIVIPQGDGEIILDVDDDGHLLGIEVLGASRLLRQDALDASD